MQVLNKPTKIAGVKLKNSLMNGAYSGSKTYEDIQLLSRSGCGAIVVGSISVKPRQPNQRKNYWLHKEGFFSLNSYGLPNGGIEYYRKQLSRMVRLAHEANKPLVANVVGFSQEEFATLVRLAEDSGADIAELNFGCPNVWEKGAQKQIISYHAKLVESTLKHIAAQKPRVKISVKISPLPPDILRDVSRVIAASGIVQAVTATNSYPNAFVTYGVNPKHEPRSDLYGLAGRSLKPISLGVVSQLSKLLPKGIDIIGCGGIASANDVQDYLDAGANAVQIATALKDSGVKLFDRILDQ